jgi:exodeoxyribonuclease V beta subunit
MSGSVKLDLTGVLPERPLVIEASAGTGKTYSLSALVARYVAEDGVTPSELLIVTFTRTAAAELRDRTRRAIVEARDACAAGVAPPDQQWMEPLVVDDGQRHLRWERLASAVASFDEASISTIHGFCQQALSQIGVRAGGGSSLKLSDRSIDDLVDEACTDLIVERLSAGRLGASWMAETQNPYLVEPQAVLDQLKSTVLELVRNPVASAVPHETFDLDTPDELRVWRELVKEAVALVEDRRRVRLEFGYDDLVNGLREVLESDEHACQVLHDRYKVVMIDESQDNDPQQWDIFQRAFSDRMITVGDPKQAIYRFRGADVYAYLAHVGSKQMMHLSTNHRSDPTLVDATNALLRGFCLGDERILVGEVAAADPDRPAALVGAPLQLRWVPTCTQVLGSKGSVTAGEARDVILRDLTHVVGDLLTEEIIDDNDPRRVNPGDIAVLVPSGFEADRVRDALTAAGVPAVRTATNSVLHADAAVREWRLLLHALARPTDVTRVRSAGLGAFIAMDLADLDTMSPEPTKRFIEGQRQCVDWATRMERSSFLAWYDMVRRTSGLVHRLLAREGGERLLTDLDHIAELLAADLGSVKPTPVLALRRLDRLVAFASGNDDSGPQVRRIDSDARAVQISTIHKSKGLEYPIVLLPFLWTSRGEPDVTIFNDSTGTRIIDTATPFRWQSDEGPFGDSDVRRGLGVRAQRGDQLRVLYVAFTRAKHRTIAWWAPTTASPSSPLSAVLFDRDADMRPLNSYLEPGVTVKSPVEVASSANPDLASIESKIAAQFRAIEELGRGSISVQPLDPDIESAVIDVVDEADTPITRRVATGPSLTDESWSRWSFTGITRNAKSGHDAAAIPVVGGADEPSTDDNTAPLTSPSVAGVEMPWAELGGGTAFGTLIHDILERVDPMSPTLDADLDRLVADGVRRSGLRLDPVVVVDGLRRSMSTPLGALFDDRALVDISVSDRLAELRFDLPLVAADHAVAVTKIGEVLLARLADNDPMQPYAASLAKGRFPQRLAGYLQGSIDGVFRVGAPDAPRFVVVDYKTNQLHERDDLDPLAAYHPAKLPEAMAHSDYPLQALLYSVALHRYLRWRLPNYDPESHLGGIAYLYLRGMVGIATPRDEGCPFGVFAWRPPSGAIEALDHLFATGSTS